MILSLIHILLGDKQMNLKKILDIDLLKTIKIKYHNSQQGTAVIFKNSAVNLAENSSICLSERFEFGRRYYRQDNRTSALSCLLYTSGRNFVLNVSLNFIISTLVPIMIAIILKKLRLHKWIFKPVRLK